MATASTYPDRALAKIMGVDTEGRVGLATPAQLGIGASSGGGVSGAAFPNAPPRSVDYVLSAADAGLTVPMDVPAGIMRTVTIPSDITAVIPIGTRIRVARAGAGEVKLDPAAGVALTPLGKMYLRTTDSVVELLKTGHDVWEIDGGDLKSAPSTDPVVVLDLVGGVNSGGATLSDISVVQAASLSAQKEDGTSQSFAANTPRRTGLGWYLKGVSTKYIGPQSLAPNNWVAVANYTPSKTAQPVQGIFSPVLFGFGGGSDAGGGAVSGGYGTESVAPGDWVTVAWKIEKGNEAGINGFRVGIRLSNADGSVTKYREAYVDDMTTIPAQGANALNGNYNPDGISWSVRRVQQVVTAGHTTYEVEIALLVPAGITRVRPQVSAQNQTDKLNTNGSMLPKNQIVWAMQVERGDKFSTWVAVAASTVTSAGDNGTVSGAFATHMAQASGTAVFIFSDLDDMSAGKVLVSIGGTELFAMVDHMRARIKGGAASARVGLVGMRGIVVLGVRWTPTAYSFCVNGGDIVTVNAALGLAGAIRINEGLGGFFRGAKGYAAGLSDAQFKQMSSLVRETWVNAQKHPNIGLGLVRLDDDFKVDSIAPRNDPNAAWVSGGPIAHLSNYSNSLANPLKHWWPRYVHHSLDVGERSDAGDVQGINDEWEVFFDPGSKTLQDAGMVGANIPVQVIPTGDGIMRITATLVSSWPAAVQALVPIRFIRNPDGSPLNTGVKYKYISGAVSGAGFTRQRFGWWEACLKVPKGQASWPAFWGLTAYGDGGDFWSQTELDVVEFLGRQPTHTTNALHSLHYGRNVSGDQDLSEDLSLTYHIFGCMWRPGYVDFYVDGRWVNRHATDTDFDTYTQYPVLNLAIGDGGGWVGVPDATTDALMPMRFDIDWVRIAQMFDQLTDAEKATVVG